MVSMRRLIVILLLWVGVIPPLVAEVEVIIDRNPVQVNESFQLVFSLDHRPCARAGFLGTAAALPGAR